MVQAARKLPCTKVNINIVAAHPLPPALHIVLVACIAGYAKAPTIDHAALCDHT